MLNLSELRQDRNLVNKIDWTMSQEKAIEMYLEWGTGWIRGHDFVSYMGQESVYFVIYDWENPPQVTLLKRTTNGAEELAKIAVPEDLFRKALAEDGYKPGVGVHSLSEELKKWLCRQIDGPPVDFSIH